MHRVAPGLVLVGQLPGAPIVHWTDPQVLDSVDTVDITLDIISSHLAPPGRHLPAVPRARRDPQRGPVVGLRHRGAGGGQARAVAVFSSQAGVNI